MGLTSGGFFGFLIVVAVGVTAATIWWWPKLAGSGIRPFLARIGLFLTGQVALVMALLTGVNNYFLFYVSWSDLLGTNNQGVHVQLNNNNSSTASRPQGDGRPLARQAISA